MTDLLAVSELTVRYGRRVALDRASFRVPEGETVAVVGPNGAGKTTLFRAILGAIAPTSGTITLGQRPGYVPQADDEQLDFPLSALEVVQIGGYRRRRFWQPLGKELREEALAALDRVGLADRARSQIGELSGGQRQRVVIARALLARSPLLLLDEPLNGVDATSQEVIVGLLEELRSQGTSALISTHDLALARRISTRMLFLNTSVVADGPTAEAFTPDVLRRTYAGSLLVVDDAGRELELLETGGHAHDHAG